MFTTFCPRLERHGIVIIGLILFAFVCIRRTRAGARGGSGKESLRMDRMRMRKGKRMKSRGEEE